MEASVIRLPEQLGTLLRAARQQRGLTQADIAVQLGVTVQAVSRLEKHAERASFDRIHRLCLLLDLDMLLRPRATAAAARPATEW